MRSPFKFLDSYSLKDKDTFFGRKEETDLFYEMVNKNRLLLVYGQSGSGKTSLVECGLANRFDVTDWYPIRVRRRRNINESLSENMLTILKETEEEGIPLSTDLVEQVEEIYAEYLRPVYLIFDQLEEVFILGDKAEQATFIHNIDHLYQSKIPCRVIFILREEYLGHLYNFEKVIPSLFDRRLRVEAISNTKIQTVLEKSFATFNIRLEAPAEDRLKEMIANICGGNTLVQLPYLQVYLDMMYREDYQRTYGNKVRGDELPPLEFTHAEIQEFGQIDEVLSKFLDFQEKEIQAILYQKHTYVLDNTVLQIMDAFVTDEGTKRPLAYTRTENLIVIDEKVRRLFPPVADEILSDCFWELEKARIIRGSDNYMELAHDSLAALLTKKRGAEQQVRKRLAATLQEYELSGGQQLLAETQLLGMADMLPSLYLDEATHAFIEKSKKAIADAKAAEKAAAAKELAEQKQRAFEERRLRHRAERNSKRARIRAWIAVLVSFLAIAFFTQAYLANLEAEKQSKLAKQQIKKGLANDIAYKAEALLAAGRRNDAFQLAAFGYQYVDPNQNAKTAKVISDAYYYNDVHHLNDDSLQLSWHRSFPGHKGAIETVAFSADGQSILAIGANADKKIWDIATGKPIPKEQVPLSDALPNESFIKAIENISTLSPQATYQLSLTENNTVTLKDAASGQLIRIFKGHNSPITAAAFSPDERFILTGSEAAGVKLWEIASRKKVHTLTTNFHPEENPPRAYAFSPDGQYLLTSGQETTIHLWSVASNKKMQTFKGHKNWINTLVFSADNTHFVSGSKDSTAILWAINSPLPLRIFQQQEGFINAVAISPTGKKILTGSQDGKAKLWELGTETPLATFSPLGGITAVDFHPTEEKILIGSQAGVAEVWDMTQDTVVAALQETDIIWAAKFSPNGTQFLTVSGSQAKLWTTAAARQISLLKGHQKPITSIAFVDNSYVITGSQDQAIKMWNAEKGLEIRSFNGHQAAILDLAILENKQLISGSLDGQVKTWGLNIDTLLHRQHQAFLLGYFDAKYLRAFGITEVIRDHLPEAFNVDFLEKANHYELASIGNYLFSAEINNNNRATYELYFSLAEACYLKASEKAPDWKNYNQSLANLYNTWQKKLAANKNFKEAEEKKKLYRVYLEKS